MAADELNLLSSDLSWGIKPDDTISSVYTTVNMVASDGSFLVFNDGGNWIDNLGDQMIDSAGDSLVFGASFWGEKILVYSEAGERLIQSDDLSLYIKRSV